MIAGLTGGIGSGKSTIARLFEILGCVIFESDTAAKEIYFHPPIRTKVKALLGAESYLSDYKINKAFISKQVFSNTTLLEQLNAIIHPAVSDMFKQFIVQHPRKIIIKETALLFEAGLEKEVDKRILVVSDLEMRINRVMQRDGINREEVEKKIKAQLSEEEKIKKADFVIINDENQLIIPQVITVYKALTAGNHA